MSINNSQPSILLIEDDHTYTQQMQWAFEPDFTITIVTNTNNMSKGKELAQHLIKKTEENLRQHTYDAIWLDLDLTGFGNFKEGLPNIQRFQALAPNTPIIVVSSDGSTSTVVVAIQNGAVDYLCKGDYDYTYWRDCFTKHINQARLEHRDKKLKKEVTQTATQQQFIGETESIVKIRKQLEKVGQLGNVTVLLLGETGVGKEVAAKYLHETGSRKNKPFVPINLSAIPEKLVESTLFGHKKGAFTGAEKDYKGILEEADGGIVFLDEIGDAPYEVQTKLLRFLEDGKVRPTGGQEKQLDVQVIAATNVDLKTAIIEKKFRQDLYERLKTFTINIPPLRERKNDLDLLCQYFQQKSLIELVDETTLALLNSYHWPGNVREFRNALKSMNIKALIIEKEKATIDCLTDELLQFLEQQQKLPTINHYAIYISANMADNSPAQNAHILGQQQAVIELNAIEQALMRAKGKKTKAAQQLLKNTDQLLYTVKKNFAEHPDLLAQYPFICAAYNLNPPN